mmetsp:Transcript_12675/g.30245  ORF Transcript_12675/g.30245 Transcript_12675/m.30245 type:complete len:200 (-) Transcript_12675:445-1044(-)
MLPPLLRQPSPLYPQRSHHLHRPPQLAKPLPCQSSTGKGLQLYGALEHHEDVVHAVVEQLLGGIVVIVIVIVWLTGVGGLLLMRWHCLRLLGHLLKIACGPPADLAQHLRCDHGFWRRRLVVFSIADGQCLRVGMRPRGLPDLVVPVVLILDHLQLPPLLQPSRRLANLPFPHSLRRRCDTRWRASVITSMVQLRSRLV